MAVRCRLPEHAGHPPHSIDELRCVACAAVWFDCPGVLAANYKTGCPDCGSIYWIVTPLPLHADKALDACGFHSYARPQHRRPPSGE